MRIPRARWTKDQPPRLAFVLPTPVAEICQALPDRLRELLIHPERSPQVIDRLFPRTHETEVDEREHRRLLGESLLERRRDQVEAYAELIAAAEPLRLQRGLRLLLPRASIDLFMRVTNDYRLLLATEMGIEDNEWQLDASLFQDRQREFVELVWLSGIQEILLEALTQ
ncbi:MAG: DUF2017 family protein [Planctomycetes bacterium]|nr:DUF2017 family protein [Planctomycetota bacterium]